jgi:hypothetical protein
LPRTANGKVAAREVLQHIEQRLEKATT